MGHAQLRAEPRGGENRRSSFTERHDIGRVGVRQQLAVTPQVAWPAGERPTRKPVAQLLEVVAHPKRPVALGAKVVRLARGNMFAAVGALKVGHEIHAPSLAQALGQAQARGYRLRRRKNRYG